MVWELSGIKKNNNYNSKILQTVNFLVNGSNFWSLFLFSLSNNAINFRHPIQVSDFYYLNDLKEK